uniref:Uncharacterized protein n=1 Tax=Anguilla anguilla TaxID=7936 RepID=A0A0E9SBP7_ANGAN
MQVPCSACACAIQPGYVNLSANSGMV